MISDVASYLAKLEEIQQTNTNEYTIFSQSPLEERLVIDANTRNIKIPPMFEKIGVIKDHNAETVYFEISRYFDNIDLSTQTCVIQYINADKDNDIYTVTKKDLSEEGKIVFGWTISNHVTAYKGDVTFAVRFYTIENGKFIYNFNTVPAEFEVQEGLDLTASDISVNVDILSQWLAQLESISYDATTTLAECKDATELCETTTQEATVALNAMLFQTDLAHARQTVTWNPDGTMNKVTHTDLVGGEIVRTDVYTYNGDIITEVRTLSNGQTLTYTYDIANYLVTTS